MKKAILTLLTIVFGMTGFAAWPIIDPELREEMDRRGDQEKIEINIMMAEQADATALLEAARFCSTKQDRRTFVVDRLKRQAEASQAELLLLLEAMERQGMVGDIRPLWIVNSVSCTANKAAIERLALRGDLMTVYRRKAFRLDFDDEPQHPLREGGREIAENLLKVNVDKVWELGFTGEGVLIGLIDTGANMDHADLQGRLWDGGLSYPHHGYDFYSHDDDPSDTHGHGTHVAGTIVGTGVSGTQTGVAPGAEIMILKVFHGEDNLTEPTMWVEAMQFAVEHGAQVLNMSLGQPLPDAGVKLFLRQACDNTLAVGVVAAVCAGNSRQIQMLAPVPHNIWSPGDCPPPHLHDDQLVNPGGISCVICVGAVSLNDALGGFSSEGPATWSDVAAYNDYPYSTGSSTNIGLIRPDVCAPGVNVKSLDINNTNGYCLKSGTSMATPCVAGTIALMLSKDHQLTPEQIDEILERTAIPLSAHKNNDFGAGRIDAFAAVNAVGDDAVDETSLEVCVFPNPSTGNFTIQCEGIKLVEVYSIDGRLVKQVTVNGNERRMEGLESGVYLVKIVTERKIFVKKVVTDLHLKTPISK